MKPQMKNMHPMILMMFNMLVDLPAPSTISYMWNWGSLLSLNLIVQLITGLLLASHYNPSVNLAFDSIIHITRDTNMGWLMRMTHTNGAAFFFILIYIHISRGILFSSYKLLSTWMSGTAILFMLMATAFVGYVLPWGQMSFWGATVITNLVSAIPYVGKMIVEWLWGGFSMGSATLNRFFVIHFMLPMVLLMLVIIHLSSLHLTGSNIPMGMNSNVDKISFHPFFSLKDSLGAMTYFMVMFFIIMLYPNSMGDPENFNPANPLNTPIHIQPEWYFLFAYAILRSIPNKLGGVIALVSAIMIILILPMKTKNIKSSKYAPKEKLLFWWMTSTFIILTWVGANPVEYPFEMIGQMYSIFYFSIFSLMYLFLLFWKQLMG